MYQMVAAEGEAVGCAKKIDILIEQSVVQLVMQPLAVLVSLLHQQHLH